MLWYFVWELVGGLGSCWVGKLLGEDGNRGRERAAVFLGVGLGFWQRAGLECLD